MPNTKLVISPDMANTENAKRLRKKFNTTATQGVENSTEPYLLLDVEGLSLCCENQVLKGDFTHLLPRLKGNGLSTELLVKAAKIKGEAENLSAVDATAGLGEDSFFLAAYGFNVTLFERNPVIFELLQDALNRAKQTEELCTIVSRMNVICGDSIQLMRELEFQPHVVLLDPMFPARTKSSLVKKKLQMLQKLEMPCTDEKELLLSAMGTKPKKLIIKRPPKGPYLANVKPDYSITGKAVRFDCINSPYDRIHKYK